MPDLLRRRGTDALIITGAETDVCVLAAVQIETITSETLLACWD